jgi:hypothetical protein
VDARAASAVADLQRATDALTVARSRYLGRLTEPRWATVPALLAQLVDAVIRAGETGAINPSNPMRAPLDLDPVDLFAEIRVGARVRVRRYGLKPRRSGAQPLDVAADVRQLAAHARTLAITDYQAVAELAETVASWRDKIMALLPEVRTSRDLPDLACQRCKRRRLAESQPDGRRLLVPAMRYVSTPMPGVLCRACGHLYQGDSALRGLAAAQS